MSDENEPTARELIEALRGGVPVKCDFCGKEVPDFCMEPEEGDMWACIWCLYRWEATENQDKFKRISELEAELAAAKDDLTVAYMRGVYDERDKAKERERELIQEGFLEGYRLAWALLRPGNWSEYQKRNALMDFKQWLETREKQKDKGDGEN